MAKKPGFSARTEAFAYFDEVKQARGELSKRAIILHQPARIRNSCGDGRLFPSIAAALAAYYKSKGTAAPRSKVGKPPKKLSARTPEDFFLIVDDIRSTGRRLTPGTINNLHFGKAFYGLCHKGGNNPDGLFDSPQAAIEAYLRARGLPELDSSWKKRVAPAFKSKEDVLNAIGEIQRRRGSIYPSDLHSYKSFQEPNFSRFYPGLRAAYNDYLSRLKTGKNSVKKPAGNFAEKGTYPTPLFFRKS
jgi:hypothetical protein